MVTTTKTKKSPRRYSAGEQRRGDIVDAVLRIIARDGVAAVTHRAVSAEAAVAHGLTTYYFASKRQMLIEAFEQLGTRVLDRARGLSAALDQAERRGASAEASADALLTSLTEEVDGGSVAAEFALILEINREPSLAAQVERWETELLEILRAQCERQGSDDPEQDAWLILSATRGLELALLAGSKRTGGREGLRATLERLVSLIRR